MTPHLRKIQIANLSRRESAAILASLLKSGCSVRFCARGHSMQPFILEGDILTVAPLSWAFLRRGDIAFYTGADQRILAHRVLAIPRTRGGIRVLARGDAWGGKPEEVPPDSILGKVVSVQRGARVFSPHSLWHRGLGYGWAHYRSARSKIRSTLGGLRRRFLTPDSKGSPPPAGPG